MLQQRTDVSETIIGENSFFEGRFVVKGAIRIDGKYEGDLLSVDQVFIGPKGKVKTVIKAANVVVEGIVVGNIHATNRVLLLPTSRVLGDIKTPELIIQNGVILEGRCTILNDVTVSAKQLITSLYES